MFQAVNTFKRHDGSWIEQRTQELMGGDVSESRLRELVDETLDERALPVGAPQDVTRLQRRIEHLEAIVTSRDWDEIRTDSSHLGDTLDDLGPPDGATEAERIARRVR